MDGNFLNDLMALYGIHWEFFKAHYIVVLAPIIIGLFILMYVGKKG